MSIGQELLSVQQQNAETAGTERPAFNSTVSQDSTHTHGGAYAALMTVVSAGSEGHGFIGAGLVPIVSGLRIRYSAWVWPATSNVAGLGVDWKLSDNTRISGSGASSTSVVPGQWNHISVDLTCQQQALTPLFYDESGVAGSQTWWDDFSIIALSSQITQTLPALAQRATGRSTPPTYTSTSVQTLPALSQRATAERTVPAFTAAAAQMFPALRQAAVAETTPPVYLLTGAQTLPAFVQHATGISYIPVITPPERVYTVPAEDRVYTVPAEDRVYTVPAEDRVLEVT